MPPQPKTRELERVPDWAISLTEKVNKLSEATTSGFAQVDVRLDTVVDNQVNLTTRVDRIEVRMDKIEGRVDAGSLRAKQPSQHDLEAQAALAAEVVERKERDEALASDVKDVKTSLVTIQADLAQNTMFSKQAAKAVTELWNNKAVQVAVIGLVVAAATAATTFLTHLGGQ